MALPITLLDAGPADAHARWRALRAPRYVREAAAPLVATAVIVAAAAVGTAPIRGAVAGTAWLELPAAFVALAPLCGLLDAIALLSDWQHYALVGTVLGTATLCGLSRGSGRRHPPLIGRSIAAAGAFTVALLLLVCVYLGGALLPRPAVALRLADPDLVTVDFHSHTDASWDGRRSFGARENREWHAATGFDVAYVTDHKSFAGALAGTVDNPARAGEGTVLLSGIETIDAGQHVNLLGAVATDSALYRGGRLNAAGFVARFATDPAPPLSLLTIPGALDRPPPEVPVAAVELSDAAPRGIRFAVDERARLLRVADSLDVAVVAGSDNHGWGRTAAAWSVMRLPGWRDLTPGELDARIRATIRRDGSRSVQVVERTGTAVGGMGLAATLPALLWTVAATLSWPERMSWLVWIWGLHLVVLAARSRSAMLGAGAAADATTRGERRLIVGSIPLEGRVVRVRARPAP